MRIHTFSSFAVAHLLAAQPNHSFDCSAFNIKLFIPKKIQHYRVKHLYLIPVENPLTGTPEFEIKVERTTHSDPLLLNAKNADYLFDVAIEDDDPNTFLQAIPRTPLFPPNHPRHLSHQIPIDPPYTCSLTETHQLLQAHIPDLPTEIIQAWTSPITVETTLMWPEPNEPASFYPEDYSFTASSSATRHRCTLAADCTDGDYFLYILRNCVILCAIFPHLLTYCTWGTPKDPLGPENITPLTETLYGLNLTELWAFPSLSPSPTATAIPQSIQLNRHPNIPATNLFPPSQSFIPPAPGKTATEVLLHIKETLDFAHAITLTC